VWDMHSPTDITLRRVLVGHRAAVNVVDFDTRYIVSASGDRTIKVWCTSTCEFVRTLNGHKRGIACLQYRDKLVVSGSSDNTIRSAPIVLLHWSSAELVDVHFDLLAARSVNRQFETEPTRVWADAQRDGRPAECRWRPVQKFRNSIPCTMPQSLAVSRCSSDIQ